MIYLNKMRRKQARVVKVITISNVDLLPTALVVACGALKKPE
jgi:hypothetical protein